jgi:hypothetical protein
MFSASHQFLVDHFTCEVFSGLNGYRQRKEEYKCGLDRSDKRMPGG